MFTFTKHTKKMFIRMIAFLFITFIIGCSSSDTILKETKEVAGGGTDIGNPAPEVVVAGYAQKGPFREYSTVWLSELNNDFEQTGRDFYDQTDSAGRFEIPAQLNSNYAELYIQGYYFDEINYNIENPHYIDSGGMLTSAIANVRDNETVNINVLTTIAKPRLLALIEGGMTFDDAYAQTCVEVLNAFGIVDDTHTLFEDMVILEEPGSGSPEGNKILLAVSAILMQISHDRCDTFCDGDSISAELSFLLGDMSEDIADDGVLDNAVIITDIESAIMSLEHAKIRTYMEDFFPDFNIPQFEEYILGDLNIQWTGFNCAGNGITSVEAVINDVETGTINAGPWGCSGHEGTVVGLNAGTYDTVTVNFLDADSQVLFTVEKTDVTVTAGQTNILDVNPGDFHTGSVNVQWDMDCLTTGISTIEAIIYDSLDNQIQIGGPWECTDSQGMIGVIPEMNDARIVLIYKDSSGTEIYRSELTGITITGGDITDTGTLQIFPPDITLPFNGSTFFEGDTISFAGTGSDYQGNPLTGADLVWTSNVDGQIGTGTSFDTDTLYHGLHTITLTANDSAVGSLSTFITLHVRIPGGIIYVGTGEVYETIQSAVDGADPGDEIIVKDGTYVENVDVNKEVVIRSENGFSTTFVEAASAADDVFHVSHNYVTIDGFTIYGATDENKSGIFIDQISSCTINNNRVGYDSSHRNYDGLYMPFSSGCTITNNFFIYNLNWGINHQDGVNNTLNSNTASHNGSTGLNFSYSSNTLISNNTCNSNMQYGILLFESDNNTVAGNTCTSNEYSGIGMIRSHDNIILNNSCVSNSEDGVMAADSNDNIISSNTTESNERYGVCVGGNSINSTISGNTLNSNISAGIYVGTSDNILYLNNFYNNTNIETSTSALNTWHSPSEITYTYNGSDYTNYLGNYYSDHNFTDTDGDGVTDNPYDLPGSEPDDVYPLAETSDNYVQ